MTRVDLDELECEARGQGLGEEIALALIARIRELEAALGEAAEALDYEGIYRAVDAARATLARGTVIQ